MPGVSASGQKLAVLEDSTPGPLIHVKSGSPRGQALRNEPPLILTRYSHEESERRKLEKARTREKRELKCKKKGGIPA